MGPFTFFRQPILAAVFCMCPALAGLSARAQTSPALPFDIAIYANARSVLDLTREELLQAYPAEMKDLEFEADPEGFDEFLKRTGERVEEFFRNFPNTLAREQVRLERVGHDGRTEDSITRDYNYSFTPNDTRTYWKEDRTERNGRPVDMARIRGFLLAPGRAGLSIFFHPVHQPGSGFRYLGRQASDPELYVIAFAQKPECGDFLGAYQSETMVAPAVILYQGLAWVDRRTCQIVRIRTDLLTPRTDLGLLRQTTEVRFGEVHFQSTPETFWVPQEVVITNSVTNGRTYRNRHHYSDFQVFLVESSEKIELPKIKKEPMQLPLDLLPPW